MSLSLTYGNAAAARGLLGRLCKAGSRRSPRKYDGDSRRAHCRRSRRPPFCAARGADIERGGAMAADAKRVGVIGAGMVGVCAALYLQRDGHKVFLVEAGVPGEGASFGNAGAFNASSVTPAAMPGVIKNVPKWLKDPLGPLSLRWTYLPSVLPYLVRFIRAGTEEKVHRQARALRPLVGATL